MSVRQDFTDLKIKASSFGIFLRDLHAITLDRLYQFNQSYLHFKDLMDNDYQNTFFGQVQKAEDLKSVYFNILNMSQETMVDSQNKISIYVNTISLFKGSEYGGFFYILDATRQILYSEREFLYTFTYTNDEENKVLEIINKSFTSIDRLMEGIRLACQDGQSMFSELESHMQAYLFSVHSNQWGDIGFDYNFRWNAKHLSFTTWSAIQEEAKECFKMLLGAILETDAIDKQIAEENASFDQSQAQHDEYIAQLQSQIAELQSQIQSAQEAASTISNNTSLISMKQQQKSDKESEKAVDLANIDQWNADIAALDPTSETYADDLASLEAEIDKAQANVTNLTETIAQLEADIAQLTSQNVELSMLVDQLPEFQSQLAVIESDVATENQNFNHAYVLHDATLARFERRRQQLPLDSSPWSSYGGCMSGGYLRGVLYDRLSYIDSFAQQQLGRIPNDYEVHQELITPTYVEVEGMPQFSSTFAIDKGYALAFAELGNNELLNVYNYNSLFDQLNNIFEYYFQVRNRKYQLIDPDNYDIASAFSSRYETEADIEKLDAKKADVDSQLAELVPQIDALSTSIESNEFLKKDKEEQLTSVNDSYDSTYAIITKTTVLIDQKEATKAEDLANIDQWNADIAALDPTSETFLEDTASLEAQIAKAQAHVADLTSEIEEAMATKASALATLVSLGEQQSSLNSEINALGESIAKDKSEKADLDATKKELDDFVANYYSTRDELSGRDVLNESFGLADNVVSWGLEIRDLRSQLIDSKDAVSSIIKQFKVVKSKSNIRNN